MRSVIPHMRDCSRTCASCYNYKSVIFFSQNIRNDDFVETFAGDVFRKISRIWLKTAKVSSFKVASVAIYDKSTTNKDMGVRNTKVCFDVSIILMVYKMVTRQFVGYLKQCKRLSIKDKVHIQTF